MSMLQRNNTSDMFDASSVIADSVTRAAETSRGTIELNERAARAADALSENTISAPLLLSIIRLAELGIVAVAGALAQHLPFGPEVTSPERATAIALIGACMTVVTLQAIDAYQIASLRRSFNNFARATFAWSVTLAILAVGTAVALGVQTFPANWFAAWFATGALILLLFRGIVATLVDRWSRNGRLERRAVIVGGGRNAEDLIIAMEAQPDQDIRICGIFDDRNDDRSPPMVGGYPKLGTVEELVEFGRRARIDMLIISIPLSAEGRVLQLLKRLWVLPLDIRLSAHTDKLRFRERAHSRIGATPMLSIFDKPVAAWDGILKRGVDIFLAITALSVLWPLMLLTALAIRLESAGPVIFRQRRFGFNNQIIDVLKFRSMYTDQNDADARRVVTRGDPRVTRVGRIIRKTSIDELPQLVNVLRGELSLVGPRPHAINAHTQDRLWDEVIEGYFGRHRVKPGITGWAQINGFRGEVDTDTKIRRRVEHDLYYIENWSLLFDFYIIAMTPLRLFDTRNAY